MYFYGGVLKVSIKAGVWLLFKADVPQKRTFPSLSTYRSVVGFDRFFFELGTGPKSKFLNTWLFVMIIVGFIDGELKCRIQNSTLNTLDGNGPTNTHKA